MAPRPMSEVEAAAALSSAARFGINPSLGTITALAAALGDPQRSYRVIQVAGTNGKGSTARMTDALLRAHGRRAGVFVSPHLHTMCEHIEVDGAPVTGELFGAAVSAAVDAASSVPSAVPEPPTQFELLTAAALWAFREAGVAWAVLEVGMGGRWDSTSVTEPDVAVVTSVGLDHTEHLGSTVERIAWDKAHVIRAGRIAVLGPGTAAVHAVFAERAAEVGARLVRVRANADAGDGDARYVVTREMRSPDGVTVIDYDGPAGHLRALEIPGPRYQAENAACALTAVAIALGTALDPSATREALATLRIAGRFEVLARAPWLVADVAHNAGGAAVLAEAVRSAFGGRRLAVVVGMLSDKDSRAVAATLAPLASRFFVARPNSPRGLDTAVLAFNVADVADVPVVECDSVAGAIARARELGGDVLVTGSVVTVAEARVALGLYPPAKE